MGMTWSDEKEQICIENKKMKKWKTSPPKKIVSLGGDVFRYAKYFTISIICYFPWAKCFFLKSEIFLIFSINLLRINHFLTDFAEIFTATSLGIQLSTPGVMLPLKWFFTLKKKFSLNTPNFGKIVVIPFLKVFGMNLAVFMPQTFRKKSGTLLSNHKTNSSFHSFKDEA